MPPLWRRLKILYNSTLVEGHSNTRRYPSTHPKTSCRKCNPKFLQFFIYLINNHGLHRIVITGYGGYCALMKLSLRMRWCQSWNVGEHFEPCWQRWAWSRSVNFDSRSIVTVIYGHWIQTFRATSRDRRRPVFRAGCAAFKRFFGNDASLGGSWVANCT